jgi:hypothetical protein
MPFDLSLATVMDFVREYKWWIAPLLPFVIAVFVLKARG